MRPRERVKQAVVGTASAIKKEFAGSGGEQPSEGIVQPRPLESIIEQWRAVPAARKMIERYGAPDEATPSLIWFENGPWKRTIVYRDEVPHDFPKPHTDVLEQFIDYRVPADKMDEIAAFDGSVVPEPTKGEVGGAQVLPKGGTADLDEVMIAGAMAHQMAEKAKDMMPGREKR